ncbi:MerR family transcriptional regulator [Sulfobacillus acidophilus TPY]|uniref:Regulatory protein MerR n=1 Tax=Sulfobacillus acidophilus (strain ATCC 700253 / DSM 10332 / NAL) TaxID=679936 RepID=G8TY54_SULAD|nr:MerR family transcriptional regulator [Sulfobacillus acidophilus TPY]AEW03961.1 regulatory protein MerR [Sulfobacillus acidophilus DSM 10332]
MSEAEGFSAAQVERLTGINAKTLHFWDRSGFLSPSLVQAHGTGSRRVYSFRDLVALRVAAQLRDAGISLQSLRKVVAVLRDMRSLENPLAETYLITNGHDVFEKRGDEVMSVLRQPGQSVFSFVIDLTRTVEQLQADIRQTHTA